MKLASLPVLAGLELSSSKISFVIAKVIHTNSASLPVVDNLLDVIGVGVTQHLGVKNGIILDIEATQKNIEKARLEAELMAGTKVRDVVLIVSGSHLRSFDSKGIVAVRGKEVHASDIERVIEAARTVNVPSERQVLHVIPREYKLDSQGGIQNPLGMLGVRLELLSHIITGETVVIQNYRKTCEGIGLRIVDWVVDPLGASHAVLTEDEKKLGVCLVDFGASGTHLIIYLQGGVVGISHIPVGSQHISHDLALGLRTPASFAEDLKVMYAGNFLNKSGESKLIEIPAVGGRENRLVQMKNLNAIVSDRLEEWAGLIRQELSKRQLLTLLGSGIVITGGGSELKCISDVLESTLELPIRQGKPQGIQGITDVVSSPRFSSIIGALRLAYRDKGKFELMASESGNRSHFWGTTREDWKKLFQDLF